MTTHSAKGVPNLWEKMTLAALLIASVTVVYALTVDTNEPVSALNTPQSVAEIAHIAECSTTDTWPSDDILSSDGLSASKVIFDDLVLQDDQLSASHCYTEWYCYLVAVYIGNGTYITERICESRTYCS